MLKGLESIIMMKIACSDNRIPEIKKRLEEIREAVKADPEFWEYYLPGLIKMEEEEEESLGGVRGLTFISRGPPGGGR